MAACKALLKSPLRFGGIFPTDPYEPVGTFVSAPEYAAPTPAPPHLSPSRALAALRPISLVGV